MDYLQEHYGKSENNIVLKILLFLTPFFKSLFFSQKVSRCLENRERQIPTLTNVPLSMIKYSLIRSESI